MEETKKHSLVKIDANGAPPAGFAAPPIRGPPVQTSGQLGPTHTGAEHWEEANWALCPEGRASWRVSATATAAQHEEGRYLIAPLFIGD